MELFHVLNRGVEGRTLFLDSQDYARFVHDLYEFNNVAPAGNSYRSFDPAQMMDLGGPSSGRAGVRKRLVDIHGWCLMKNHYHLILSERVEGGLSKFMLKVNVGYAKYFNARYERNGFVFQGKTKKVLIKNQAHFLYLLHYVHLNPLDFHAGYEKWRGRDKGSIKDVQTALSYLEAYKWSSYPDYSGTANFPSLITTSLFKNALGDYKTSITTYLKDSEERAGDQSLLE